MRCVTYAGETVTTTDDVAAALVTLTAAVARVGEAEAVRIPIVMPDSHAIAEADLVIGVGNDVLSAPTTWEGKEPDFSEGCRHLTSHRLFPAEHAADEPEPLDDVPTGWDADFGGYIDPI